MQPLYTLYIHTHISSDDIRIYLSLIHISKLLADLFVLLTNFWSIPTIYPMTDDEAWQKFLMIKSIMDNLGLPVIDDEIVKLCKEKA